MQKQKPDQIARDMVRLYERAYQQIMGSLAVARKSDNYWRIARQANLLERIGEIIDRFQARAGDYLKRALEEIAEYQTGLALEDFVEFQEARRHTEKWHLEYNQKYVEQTFEDTFAHIAGQTQRMKDQIKQELRKDAAEVFRYASAKGTSRREAYRQLRDKILTKDPSFQFIDKAGRKWDSKVYLDMLTHTVMSSTLNEVYSNTLVNEGHDLVKVSHSGAIDACKHWEGVVLSLTGATTGYPTVVEATATGEVFHPRCRHRLLAYHKDIDDFFEKEGKAA